MPMFEFQIVTDTTKEAEQFMAVVAAEDVAIEEWEYNVGTPTELAECYGFGTTQYSPKQLRRIADSMGVVLAYAKNQEIIDREANELVDRVTRAGAIVKAMNLTSEREMLHQMFVVYKQLADEESK